MFASVAHFLFPPLCFGCGTYLTRNENGVCSACRHTVHSVISPRCPVCAMPSDGSGAADVVCAECRRDPPAFSEARACRVYDGAVQDAIRRSKAGGDPTAMFALVDEAAPWFEAVAGEWGGRQWMTPPPHRADLVRRGWDPARLAARRAMSVHGVEFDDPIRKLRRHRKQAGLGREERRRALDGAFTGRAVSGDWVVFDDVMTTGATLRAISNILVESGAESVVVVVIARSI